MCPFKSSIICQRVDIHSVQIMDKGEEPILHRVQGSQSGSAATPCLLRKGGDQAEGSYSCPRPFYFLSLFLLLIPHLIPTLTPPLTALLSSHMT